MQSAPEKRGAFYFKRTLKCADESEMYFSVAHLHLVIFSAQRVDERKNSEAGLKCYSAAKAQQVSMADRCIAALVSEISAVNKSKQVRILLEQKTIFNIADYIEGSENGFFIIASHGF